MDTKTYEQMKSEFEELYVNEINPRLTEYEKERKEGAPKILAFKITWFSFISCILMLAFANIFPTLKIIGFIFLFITLCSALLLVFLTKDDKKDKDGATVIKSNFENDLKKDLMKYFLEIFSKNADWKKGIPSNYFEKLKDYRKLSIFNPFPYILFNDTISLVFKNVEINIYEINTAIFNNTTIILIPFLLVFFCILSIPVLGLFIVLFILLKFLIVFFVIALICGIFFVIKKSVQYAPFKGIVVELKMNKEVKGHTFFLNKSTASKKISINRKKYENVNLESIDFMKKYDVFSTDQIESRYLLTTAMIDRLENLFFAFQANYIRGSFKDNKLILAIDTGKDMFAMGSDFKESNSQTFKDLFNEIVSILKIVDQLKLDERTGL